MTTASPIRYFPQLFVAAVLIIGLSACADRPETEGLDVDTTAVPTDTMGTMMGDRTATDTVEVGLVEYRIDMPRTLPAGRTIFKVTNNGTEEHNFEIEGQGMEEVFPQNLRPAESNTMEVDLEEGTYTVYCPVGNHRDEGMETTLTVQASGGMPGGL